jgi:hypothetical protein
MSEKPEFGGLICCNPNTGEVSATEAEKGKIKATIVFDGKTIYEGGTVKPTKQCPAPTTRVGEYHSHPDKSEFSSMGPEGINQDAPSDELWVFANEMPLFLGNQEGKEYRLDITKKFDPVKGYGPPKFTVTPLP